MRYLACDFETFVPPDDGFTTEGIFYPYDKSLSPYPVASIKTGVWGAGAYDVDTGEYWSFDGIAPFFKWLFEQPNCNVVFHNLGGFDHGFIWHYLLVSRDFKHVRYNASKPVIKRCIVGRTDEFTVFNKKSCYNFFDSKNFMATSIRTLGELLAKTDEKYADVGKTETPLVKYGETIEQTKKKDGSYWTRKEAFDYLQMDCEILGLSMQEFGMPTYIDNGITSQSAIAYKWCMESGKMGELERVDEFKVKHYTGKIKDKQMQVFVPKEQRPLKTMSSSVRVMGREMFTQEYAEKLGIVVRDHYLDDEGKEYLEKNGKPMSKSRKHKVLTNREAETRIYEVLNASVFQKAYKGGFTYVNPEKQCVNITKVYAYDINSMYPWIYATKDLPALVSAIYTKTANVNMKMLEEAPYYIAHFRNLRAKPKEGIAPILKPRTDFTGSGIDTTFYGEIASDMTLTSIEVQYLLENYEIEGEMEVINFVELQPDLILQEKFREHCEKYMVVKEKTQGFERFNAKLMLNMPYGKLGEFTVERHQAVYTKPEGAGKLIRSEEYKGETGSKVAPVPAAAFITAYGRVHLGETINAIGMDKFIYCDTDSMYLTEKADGLEIDDNKLGAWSYDGEYTDGYFIKPKTYGYKENGKWKTVTAGIGKTIPEKRFKNKNANPYEYSIRAVRADGGIILPATKIEINTTT